MVFLWFSYDFPKQCSGEDCANTFEPLVRPLGCARGVAPLTTGIYGDPQGIIRKKAADFRYFQVGEVLSGWWFGTFFSIYI